LKKEKRETDSIAAREMQGEAPKRLTACTVSIVRKA
jgi:hypothetical protein